MEEINLATWSQDDCTLGRLSYDEFQCFTLELPWLENEQGVSCIPEGRYLAFKRKSPKNGLVLELESVPNRTFIQIHAGNYTRQIEGCILVGDSIKFLDKDAIPDVTNSKRTLDKLLDVVPERVYINITRIIRV